MTKGLIFMKTNLCILSNVSLRNFYTYYWILFQHHLGPDDSDHLTSFQLYTLSVSIYWQFRLSEQQKFQMLVEYFSNIHSILLSRLIRKGSNSMTLSIRQNFELWIIYATIYWISDFETFERKERERNYTGWPEKNATAVICNFNDVIDKMSLICFIGNFDILMNIVLDSWINKFNVLLWAKSDGYIKKPSIINWQKGLFNLGHHQNATSAFLTAFSFYMHIVKDRTQITVVYTNQYSSYCFEVFDRL